MIFYLAVFVLLWVLFLFSAARGRDSIVFEYFALAIFVLVAGQRFETGNDWLVYREHYVALQELGLRGAAASGDFPAFESLYVVTAWLFGKLFDFQLFLFAVAIFNGVVIFRLARFWGAGFSGLCAIYFAWIYLATQMATTRYSIAISLILLALIAIMQGRRIFGWVLVFLAVGYHSFSIAIIPVIIMMGRPLSVRHAIGILIGGMIAIKAVFFLVSSGVLSWLPFAEKIALYLDIASLTEISPGSAAYIMLNLAFLVWSMLTLADDRKSNLVKWSVFYLLFFQVALWMLPVFWSRVQIFTLTIQACVLSQYIVTRQRLALLVGLASLSFVVMMRFLIDPAFISYIPYQSYLVDKIILGTARADGEERFYEAIVESKVRRGR